MKILESKNEDHSNIFIVELDLSEETYFLDRAYKKMAGRVQIDGFRQGKAPRPLIEKALGGRLGLLREVIDDIPTIKRLEFAQMEDFSSSSDIMVNVIELEPAIKLEVYCPQPASVILGDYRSVRVPPMKSEFSEEKLNDALNDLRRDKADYGPTERDTVQANDLTVFDVTGMCGQTLLLHQKEAQYIIRPGSPYPIRGFADALLGAKLGEETAFSLEVPPDFGRAELIGQMAEFKVVVKEIKEQILPELTDEFAQSFGEEFTTLEVLKDRIRQNLTRSFAQNAQRAWDKAVLDAALDKAEIKFSGAMVGEEVGRMMSDDMMRMRNESKNPTDFTKQLEAYNRDEMSARYEPVAREAVTRSLYLQQLIKEENITVNDEELDTEINIALDTITDEELKKQRAEETKAVEYREHLRTLLLSQKALNLLGEIASSSASISAQTPEPKKEEGAAKSDSVVAEGAKVTMISPENNRNEEENG